MSSMLSSIALLVMFPIMAMAEPTNRTIDDTLSDSVTGQLPDYVPGEDFAWHGINCSCAIKPSTTSAFDGTWMAVIYNPTILNTLSVSFSFEGLSISRVVGKYR